MQHHRRTIRESANVISPTATDAPAVVSIDLRVIFPPDAPRTAIAAAVEEAVRRAMAQVETRPQEVVSLPEVEP